MDSTKQTHVSEEKKEEVKKLVELINSRKTILLASIKSLPSAQFQKIKKSLSDSVKIKVPKKRMLKRAIDGSSKDGIKELDNFLKEDIAVLISDTSAFELASKLDKTKSPVKAKIGQESPEDIEIEAGQTDLPAGPAVSELGSLGLQVKVTNGKIEIMQPKVIVKKGQKINETAAGVMSKLDILPFSAGFVPIVAYDSDAKTIYETLLLDEKELMGNLKSMFSKANSFATSIGYFCKETIIPMLVKANSHENALDGLIKTEEVEEKKEDSEVKKEVSEEAKEGEEEKNE